MSRNGFPAARPISPDAIFLGLSILILVTFIIAWTPSCQAGSEIRSDTGMGYTVFATGLAGPRGLLFSRSGDLFAVEQYGGTIVRITSVGGVSRFAKGFSAPHDNLHEFGEASPRSIAPLTIPDQTSQSHDSLPKEGAPNLPYRNPNLGDNILKMDLIYIKLKTRWTSIHGHLPVSSGKIY